MQTLQVHTPGHSYPIHIGHRLLDNLAELIRPHIRDKAAIISNETVAPLYLAPVEAACRQLGIPFCAIILPDGEQYKSNESLQQIYTGLLQHHTDRRTTLLALGGGVIGDLAGFAAATYQRGIPFIQIPTTLLSQVDSSVGGKTGINHPLGKNMIGAFYQPQAVIADTATLRTLPPREFSAGLAEVIKYALLGDINFLAQLEHTMPALMQQDQAALAGTIRHCCQMKADIVEQDEKEHGIRAHLNLGHTFGHAIETQMGYGNWLHGEAVAAGMVLAARLSERKGYLKTADTERIIRLLQAARLPVSPPDFSADTWLAHMQHDKKNQAGQIRLVLLKQLGQAAVEAGFSREDMASLLQSV
ncbi:3-dehydroquinate synthase [Eikenella sp. Marseille-P7795]|uniref:3-dehydroquinate synthase n=1 Tax=Eikenella sp. Marseille-P7795 TaxID=2866577 RepID=UPI001CE3E270|nr:3-dehydroquinate synthase [Eikenella sp. Marseille-P7795]